MEPLGKAIWLLKTSYIVCVHQPSLTISIALGKVRSDPTRMTPPRKSISSLRSQTNLLNSPVRYIKFMKENKRKLKKNKRRDLSIKIQRRGKSKQSHSFNELNIGVNKVIESRRFKVINFIKGQCFLDFGSSF